MMSTSICMDGFLVCLFWRILIRTYGGSHHVRRLQCQASAESIMDYGQNILLSTGNFLCFAPLVNSTMDFSEKLIKDGIVDSPIEKKVHVKVVYSSSSHAKQRKAASMSVSDVVRLMQRKVYEDANYGSVVTLNRLLL